MNYFDVLELPARYALDRAVLEERYRAESRLWHPDRHGKAEPAERAHVLQRATDLNESYRVLRDDQKRAEYLLRLRGVDLHAETGPGRVPPSPAFLMAVLELREDLQDAREARDDDRVRRLAADVEERVRRDREGVAALFARLEAGTATPAVTPATDDQRALDDLAQALIRLRYYARFLDETTAYEEARQLEADAGVL